ncbi:hypothetical protein CMQ_1307 [Grosmannia clavigera kw1407]|uniref:Uncharacterized protein n=1 Tax=Grosmannia clavigera (strain kw1407 / UAMH 11150) TaxID=655863 RepID=F0XCJ6_GROCL|nr:uncharacterized protein CMQ_1307 [Grosmannia clavigera kw1407]EFX04379.1 hypothetical protein CMQ_1307 [Grosmannia clavigera kw1407]
MSQYGACCNPEANFPDPNRRTGSAGRPITSNRDRQYRRSRFFSPRLLRVSEVLQNPMSISLREIIATVFVVFSLYHAYLAGGHMYEILALRDVGVVCNGASAMQCLRYHASLCLGLTFGWAANVVPWGILAVVAAFIGEELLRAVRRNVK